MIDWWNGLTTLNQVFYAVAVFFSVIFVWQFISAVMGLAGGEADVDADVDVDVDADVDFDADADLDGLEAHSGGEAVDTIGAFKILSIRAILAFCTLFAWAASFYLNAHKPIGTALLFAIGWGLAGGVVVTILVHWMRGLAETGNPKLSTCVGARGTVYMDVPARGGQGQVRVPVSGAISMVRARSASGEALKEGTPVRVVRLLDATTVEVQPIEAKEGEKEAEK